MRLYNDDGPVQCEELTRKKWYYWLVSIAAGLAVALLIMFWVYLYAHSPGPLQNQAEIRVYIPSGTGVRKIQSILSKSGVIDDDIRFAVLTKVLGVAQKLKAGEYLFVPGSTPLQIIDDLSSGKTILRAITLPEGSTLFQVADILEKGEWGAKESFLALVYSQEFIQSLGFNAESLEGYLFPETYFFPKGERLAAIIEQMVGKGRQVMAEECQNMVKGVLFVCSNDEMLVDQGENLIFSIHQVLTLASIIEKEAALDLERGLVARVFLNRLNKNMKLQTDPTVIYGLQKFGESLTKTDLVTPGPYNTYLNKGLPTGPICSPGRSAIRAVFQPSEGSFYYFVSQNDGSHFFSKTLKEHNRAVQRLRQGTADREATSNGL